MMPHYTFAGEYCPGYAKNPHCLLDVHRDGDRVILGVHAVELRCECVRSKDEGNCILKVGVAYTQLDTYSPDALLVGIQHVEDGCEALKPSRALPCVRWARERERIAGSEEVVHDIHFHV